MALEFYFWFRFLDFPGSSYFVNISLVVSHLKNLLDRLGYKEATTLHMGQLPFLSKISTAQTSHKQPWPHGMNTEFGGLSAQITHSFSTELFLERLEIEIGMSFLNLFLG